MKTQSISKNYSYNIICQVFVSFIPIIVTPYLARTLQAETLGIYNYTYTILTYFLFIGKMNLKTYGLIYFAQNKESVYTQSSFFWGMFAAKTICVFSACVLYYALGGYGQSNILLFRIMSIGFISELFDISWLYECEEDFKGLALKGILFKIASTVGIFIFVRKPGDIYKYALVIQIGTVLANLSLWLGLRNKGIIFYLKKMKPFKILIVSVPMAIQSILIIVYTSLGKNMILWITGSSSEVAYYSLVYSIVSLVAVFSTSICVITFPRMVTYVNSSAGQKISDLLETSIRYISFLAFPLALGLNSVARSIIPIFLGNGYESCVAILEVLSVYIILSSMNNLIAQQCLMAHGQVHLYTVCVMVGVFFNFLSNSIFISIFGALGAAIALVLTEAVIFSCNLYFSREKILVNNIAKVAFPYFAAALIMTLLVKIVAVVWPWKLIFIIQIPFGIVAYFGVLWMIREPVMPHLWVMLRSICHKVK